MTDFGRVVIAAFGRTVRASATDDAEYKVAGLTLDWATVAAVGSDTLLPDGVTIPNGAKGLQFGTVLTKITASGKYGPADTTAADGRQTPVAGSTFILDTTILQVAPLGITGHATDHPPVINGGTVWKSRLQVGGVNQVTLATLLGVLPRLKPLEDA